MVRIVMISGSLRAESVNTAALRAAERYLGRVSEHQGTALTVTQIPIDDLPHYSDDIVDVGWPHPVRRLRLAVSAADALMIATPEYNAAMPGALKNALDWLAPPYARNVLRDRWVATLSASLGADGATSAQDDLRHVLEASGARLANPEQVTFTRARDLVDAHGEIADPEVLTSILRLAEELLTAATASPQVV